MSAVLRLALVGDCHLPAGAQHPLIGPRLKQLLASATWACSNCEGALRPATGTLLPKSGPALTQDADGLRWLVKQGLAIQNLANNHIMDWGAKGLAQTRDLLQSLGARTLGAGMDQNEAEAPLWLEQDGRRLALLAVAEAQFGVLDGSQAQTAGYAWVGSSSLEARIAAARREADAVIVLVHAGLEDTELPLPEWRRRYRSLLAVGADAVVAHHPHVAQGVEFLDGRPIFYSLGNFAMLRPNANAGPGLIALLEFGPLGLQAARAVPVALHDGRIELLNDAAAEALMQRLNQQLSVGYVDAVDRLCLDRLRSDYAHFERQASLYAWLHPLVDLAGLSRWHPLRNWLARKSLLWTHNLQIESHRYTVLRGLAAERREDRSRP